MRAVPADVGAGSTLGAWPNASLPVEATLVADIAATLSAAAVDPDEVERLVSVQVAHVVGEGVLLAVLDESGQSFARVVESHIDPVAATRANNTLARAPLRTDMPLLERAIAGEILVLDLADEQDRKVVGSPYVEGLVASRIRSMALVPVAGARRVHGVLVIGRDRDRPGYSDADLALVQVIARLAGRAMDGASLVGSLKVARDRADRDLRFITSVLDAMPQQVAVIQEDGTIVAVNAAWRTFAADNGGDAGCGIGANLFDVLDRAALNGGSSAVRIASGARAVVSGQARSFASEVACVTPTDERYYRLNVLPLGTPSGGALLAYTDLTSERQLAEELAHRATHDLVTDLPNRLLFEDRAQHAFAHAARNGRRVAVLYVDLNDFKLVNDMYGHAVGDIVLRTVAERLCAVARASDTVARLGGDEFVVLVEDADGIGSAPLVAERINEELARGIRVGALTLRIDASVGIAFSDESSTPAELVRRADTAMYRAKHDEVPYVVHSDEISADANRRIIVERDLPRALREGQLSLVFQPVVDLDTGRTVRLEALLRWQHPELGDVPPAFFIPIAEHTGDIDAIGIWVLEEALRIFASHAADVPDVGLSVNVAPRQLLDESLVRRVLRALATYAVEPSRVCIEVTESAVLYHAGRARDHVVDLRQAGLGIAIDDFGSGYSSLERLVQLPVTALKVDQALVAQIDEDPTSRAVVDALSSLTRALRLELVAEGIETEAQRTRLVEIGVPLGQGFLLGEPATDAAAFSALQRA